MSNIFSSFVSNGGLPVLGFLTLPISSNCLTVLSTIDFEIRVFSSEKVALKYPYISILTH